MGTALGIVAVIGIVVFLVWVFRQPTQETTMGMENRARREANKAAKRTAAEGQSES
jgi:hypothetical protein